MTTLILNVDRDNDYGDKASVPGPVIGYSDCYEAALKLISIDPEDSDANALFGALKIYDDLKKEGEDVDIALITGDSEVGPKSDQIIASQIDEVLKYRKFDDVILATDGAEDDYIMPLILSRIKIRYVKHIIVRHNQNIESVYYYIVKALKDKKIANKFQIPFGLVFLTYGLVSLSFIIYSLLTPAGVGSIGGPSAVALTFVSLILGAYFIERAFEVSDRALKLVKSFRQYAEETRVSFISYIIAFSLVFAGIAASYVIASGATVSGKKIFLDQLLVFISYFTWWMYGAIIAREGGTGVEMLVNGKSGISKNIYVLLFTLSVGFIIYGMINYIRYILNFIPFSSAVMNIALLILGIIVAVTSSIAHKYYSEKQNLGPITNVQNSIFHGKE
jgi:putative membrane protein